jgi:hypothetical protein
LESQSINVGDSDDDGNCIIMGENEIFIVSIGFGKMLKLRLANRWRPAGVDLAYSPSGHNLTGGRPPSSAFSSSAAYEHKLMWKLLWGRFSREQTNKVAGGASPVVYIHFQQFLDGARKDRAMSGKSARVWILCILQPAVGEVRTKR